MKPPLDTDQYLPTHLDRAAAATLLSELLPAQLADKVWDGIVGPLYDAREMTARWSRGKCRSCRVDHPGLWADTIRGRSGAPWPGHLMRCPKYVGPLEHRAAGGSHGLFGWRPVCSCGEGWYEYDGEGNRQEHCPKADEDWRGPRPGGAS